MQIKQEHKASYFLLALLIVSSLVANIIAPRLFMGFNYLLGSIPVLLVLRLYGTGWGLLTGIIAASWTYVLFGHPYAMVWLTAEPLFIGIVINRTRLNNMVLVNTLYWPLIGIPLLWFFFKFVMHLPLVGTLPAALMFWIIGITNSLIATIILQITPLHRIAGTPEESRLISIRQAIFSMMMALVVIPAIIVMIINGRAILHRNEKNIIDILHMAADNYSHSIHLILDPVRLLLKSDELDGFPDSYSKSIGIIGIWTIGQSGTAKPRYWKYSPAFNPLRFKAGQIVTDQPGIPDSVAVRDPNASRLVLLQRDYLRNHLTLIQKQTVNIWATLLDSEGSIISTTNPNIADQTRYAPRDFGEPRAIKQDIYQILPPMPTYITLWSRVQKSWYSFETTADEQLGWTWIIETPFAPFQKHLLQQQTYALLILLALCLTALAVSLKVSRRFSTSILGLAETTTGLASRVENDLPLEWPDSRLEEVALLTMNFKGVASALRSRFKELRRSHDMMEENVYTRTAELHAAKEQAERVYRLVPSGLFAVDRECKIIIWNKKAEEITGYSANEALGQSCLIFSKEPCSSSCRLYNGSMVPAENIECTIRSKDGRELTVSKNIDYLIDSSSNIIGGIETFEDITEKKELENKLRQSQKMETIGTLAGGIAHDFNNLLGAILGYAEIAREDVGIDRDSVRNSLNQVINAGNRAKDLVRQILAFSRQTEMQLIPVQPAVIIKEAIGLLRSSLPTTIEIQQDIDPDAGFILADPTQIHQILINLCTNSFHALEITGGIVTISLKKKCYSEEDLLTQPEIQPGQFVQLSVRDNGPGIPLDIRDRIFDPYFTTKETGKGTGMGLAITHGIVKSYGGFITCESDIGVGTVFDIYLPSLSQDIAPENDETTIISGRNERILVVDDEPLLLEMNKTMLEKLGYSVTVSKTSPEALASFKAQPDAFDLVITDQTMPEMTGFDLARHILQIRPDIPIILCTGYSSIISEENAKALGIKGFAHKPLNMRDLSVIIRKVLNGGNEVNI
ncbi:response regulator [Desulfopila aestuarii]|nr:response regulator [Desulfopila aestuarii]